MRTLYSIGIGIYGLGIRTAALLGHEKAALMCKGWRHQFDNIPPEMLSSPKTAWFHASSLGEFEQARPILERFKAEHPDYRILLSFFSPSGYEVRKNYNLADHICYLPLDTRHNAREFIRLFHPSVAFFVKYDHWFNFLHELKRNEIPVFLFSAIFRPGQYFFRPYGRWFFNQLKTYRHVFVQNDVSSALILHHGLRRVTITGDTRFDRVNDIAQNVKPFPLVEQFLQTAPGAKVLLAGSSWEEDEKMIQQYASHPAAELKIILAPHMINPEHIDNIVSLFGEAQCVRYSQLTDGHLDLIDRRVLIIDNIGILSSLYQYADVAYIGGGFGKGIHNILEAMTYGKPVVFGPNHTKFQEAVDILSLGGGKTYVDAAQLKAILDCWLSDSGAYRKAAECSRHYVVGNLGASDKIFRVIDRTII